MFSNRFAAAREQMFGAIGSACLAAAMASAAPMLRVDFNANIAQNESGFLSFETVPTETYGSVTVASSDSQGNPYDRGGVTDNPPGFTYGELYRDFIYHNTSPFNMTIAGLIPSETYDIALFSYDDGLGAVSVTTTFTPTGGTLGSNAVVTYFSGSDPVTDYEYSDTQRWVSDGSGQLTFTISATNAVRMNGFEMTYIPEPAAGILTALLATCLGHRRFVA